MQNQFRTGEFQSYYAKHRIHLGDLEMELQEGDVVEYDGKTMKIGSEEFSYPKLKSAIKAEWLSLVVGNSQSVGYVPQSSQIVVRPSTPSQDSKKAVLDMVGGEESVVGSLNSFKENRKTASENANKKTASVTEGGVPVAPVTVSKTSSLPLLDMPDRERNKFPIVQEEEGLEFVRDINGSVRVSDSLEDTQEGVPVNTGTRKIPPAKTEIKLNTSGQLKVVSDDAVDSNNTPSSEGVVIGNIKDRKTKVASKRPQSRNISSKKTSSPKLLEWDMSQHWKKRVKEAVTKYASQPSVLDQILEVETDTVVKHIKKQLS
jgi:hypothetical protein